MRGGGVVAGLGADHRRVIALFQDREDFLFGEVLRAQVEVEVLVRLRVVGEFGAHLSRSGADEERLRRLDGEVRGVSEDGEEHDGERDEERDSAPVPGEFPELLDDHGFHGASAKFRQMAK